MKAGTGRSATFLAAVLLWLALAAVFSARMGGRSADDFFITYRYAQNLAQGNGLVFNHGERVFGTTAPGMALLLAAGHLLTRIPIHWLGTFSTAASLVGIALLILAEAAARGRRPEAWVGGTLLLTSTFIWGLHGAEGPVVVLLLLLAARWGERRPVLAGVTAGFAAWCRPDAGLAVGLLGLLLWREHRRLPWRYGMAAFAVLAIGAGLALAWFGDVLPNSWQAKQAEALMGFVSNQGARFWPASLPLFRRHLGAGLPWVLGLGLAGLWPLFRWSGRPGRLLVLHSVALAAVYPFLGVSYTPWYILPVVMALLYGVAFAAGAAGRAAVSGLGDTRRASWAGILLAAGLLAPALLSIGPRGIAWYRRSGHPLRFEGYRLAGLWLRQHSRPGDAIASMEVGTLAYFSQRRVEDLQGLVTPRSIPFTLKRDPAGAFLAQPTRFVVTRPSLMAGMRRITRRGWFRRKYERVALFQANTADWALIYGAKPGVDLSPSPAGSPPTTHTSGSGSR